jgi:hypothetical protein
MAILGNLPGVDRPAIASLVPTTGGLSLLIDAGANTDVKPINLMQFGVMGSVYWKHVYNAAHPRVGILSNGEETSKGTDLTRAGAAALLQMAPYVNYVGYVEGRDINRAKVDVVVTDGFTGNVALKTMEGFAGFMMGNLRELFEHGLFYKMAYLLVRKKLRAIRERLDPAEYGGAPLLGVNGVAVIAHGSSNARAIRNAVRAAANEALVRHVNAEIVETLRHSPAVLIAKTSSSKGIRGLFSRVRDRLHLNREGQAEPGDAREHIGAAPRNHPSDAASQTNPALHDESHTDALSDDRKASLEAVKPSSNGAIAADAGSRETTGFAAENAAPAKTNRPE